MRKHRKDRKRIAYGVFYRQSVGDRLASHEPLARKVFVIETMAVITTCQWHGAVRGDTHMLTSLRAQKKTPSEQRIDRNSLADPCGTELSDRLSATKRM